MKNVPEKIYLQIDADGETPEDFADLEVTWCVDRINENDIAYIREPSSPTVKEGTEPIAMKAGDLRVMVNGEPVAVDFRIISEELYQKLTRKPLDR